MKKLTLILLLFCLQGKSQGFDCNLKPPVYTIHFGSGTIRDLNATALYNYGRVGSSCPTDGHYAYTPYTSNCFGGDWHTLTEDHTPGDAQGNMLLVNASYEGGTFFTTEIKGLKGGSTYEFAAWMMNVCRISDKCPFPLLPKITARLQTLSGKTVAIFSTGEILRRQVPHWTQHRARFTMPNGAENLILTMIDHTPGGCGNDFAIDDITFRECVKTQSTTKPPKKTVVTKQPPPLTTKQQPKKETPQPSVKKVAHTEPVPVQQTTKPQKDTLVLHRKPPAFPVPPPVLTQRSNTVLKQFETEAGQIKLDLYDNGEIDGDTVSIYHNNTLVVAHAKLSQKPISLHIAINPENPHHELVMVAENLGTIPPNTSLMIVTAGSKRYQVFISSTEQKNGKLVFDLKQ